MAKRGSTTPIVQRGQIAPFGCDLIILL